MRPWKIGTPISHAFANHLLPFHMQLVGKLGRGQVIGHAGTSLSRKSGRQILTPGADVSTGSAQFAADPGSRIMRR